jgi:hypothetical protein
MANTSLVIKKNTHCHKKRHDLGHLATREPKHINTDARGGEEHTNKSCMEGGEEW